jgi:hypothetical protein
MAFSTAQPSAATLMLPLVCRSSPARMRSKVDLPHPLGPTTHRNSPGATLRSISASATTALSPSPYCLRSLAISTAAPRRSCTIGSPYSSPHEA